MGLISLVLGLAGGVCGVMGVLTLFGALPPFLEAEEAIGPQWGTTLFFWGLAVLLLLSSIAINTGHRESPFE